MTKLQKLLRAAERPVVIIGGSRWSQAACDALCALPSASRCRCALRSAAGISSMRCIPAMPAISASDQPEAPRPHSRRRLVLLVGGRLGELPSQSYTLFDIPGPRPAFVHVHPGAEELGRVYHPHLAIHAAPTGFAAALEGLQPPSHIRWRAEAATAHNDYLAWTDKATPQPGGVNLGEIMVWLREHLPADAFVCNGAGNFAGGAPLLSFQALCESRRAYRGLDGLRRAGRSGDEAALSRSSGGLHCRRRRLPDERPGIRHRRAIRTPVRDHPRRQRRLWHHPHAPGARVSRAHRRHRPEESGLRGLCARVGGYGATVEKTADFPAAYAAATASGKPAIISLKVDPEAITPGSTLTAIREKALANPRG